MQKIEFKRDVGPHLLAVIFFFLVTVLFFSPVFFENKVLNQGDIRQFLNGSKALRDFRDATGEEGLWAGSVFSGMPAYFVNLDWSDDVVVGMKKVLSLFLPHPVCNVFLSLLCYYILLLTFRVRPYLAMAGAVAFGLSTYMVIGLAAGHNSRIGAIAFMPLVIAGIHLAFTDRKILGFGVTAGGLALHLREDHVQITYYLLIAVAGYGLMQLVVAIREKKYVEFLKTALLLTVAAVIALGTFFGPLMAINEFSKYSTRGKSELVTTSQNTSGSGLPRSYAFQYSNGITEPITALVPDFYGGASSTVFINDPESESYKALVQSGSQDVVNKLAPYTRAYWGDQPLSAPYYAGAVVVFLFALGCQVVEKKYVWWLSGVSAFAVMLSWGSNFEGINYFLFDHLPGLNKFRSVTFVMIVVFLSLPLLGLMGLEKVLQSDFDKVLRRKLLIAFAATGGLCLLFVVFSGLPGYLRPSEAQLPAWFLRALHDDRQALLRSDALRSLAFIFMIFIALYLNIPKKVSLNGFLAFLIFITLVDMIVVDKRYFTKDNYVRKRELAAMSPMPSEERVLRDKGMFRVFNYEFYEAGTSYYFRSCGGYNGVRLKRYQELFDSCLVRESEAIYAEVQGPNPDFKKFGALNMLNARYLIFGEEANAVIRNDGANGIAWFAREVLAVNSPNEELTKIREVNTREVAVVDVTRFKVPAGALPVDSAATIRIVEEKPYLSKYEVQSAVDGLVVFSEIYYPAGWTATIDGKEVDIIRADYVLRALKMPAGTHVVEFAFHPSPYFIGNKVTMASSWLLLIVVAGSLGFSWGSLPNQRSESKPLEKK